MILELLATTIQLTDYIGTILCIIKTNLRPPEFGIRRKYFLNKSHNAIVINCTDATKVGIKMSEALNVWQETNRHTGCTRNAQRFL